MNNQIFSMRKVTIQFILLLAVFGISVAKAVPAIDAFTTTGLTTDGKILVSNTTSTSKDFFVRISRPFLSSTNAYESVSMSFHIIYRSVNGEEELTSEIYVGTPDFNGGAFFQGNYQVSIPAGRVGGAIHIRYYYTHMQTGDYIGPTLSSVFFETTDNNPPPPPLADGIFRRYNSTEIYISMEGKWRHIERIETLKGLFDYNYVMTHLWENSLVPSPLGDPIVFNSGLPDHNGTVYFMNNNIIRHITSMAVKEKYHFNWNSVRRVSSISGYVLGPPLY